MLVATEARLTRGPDGLIRSQSDGRGYAFWVRYLEAFDLVRVLARVADGASTLGVSVEGQGVVVAPVTDFQGLGGLLRAGWNARREVNLHVGRHRADAMIGRVPGTVGSMMISARTKQMRPLALEIVGDPFTAMRTRGGNRLFAEATARVGRRQMQKQCRRADAASYVTETALQSVYPAADSAYVTNYSSVELPDVAFRQRHSVMVQDCLQLVTVGTLAQAYKGHDVLLDAVAHLRQLGVDSHLSIVGDGRLRDDLRQRAYSLGISDRVTFMGQFSTAEDVRRSLDRADMFVLPSRSEGLPRALIEAMARGLPCIATSVGGVSELLEQEFLASPGESRELAEIIAKVGFDEVKRRKAALRNYHVAMRYHSDVLGERRNAFYTHVYTMTNRPSGRINPPNSNGVAS